MKTTVSWPSESFLNYLQNCRGNWKTSARQIQQAVITTAILSLLSTSGLDTLILSLLSGHLRVPWARLSSVTLSRLRADRAVCPARRHLQPSSIYISYIERDYNRTALNTVSCLAVSTRSWVEPEEITAVTIPSQFASAGRCRPGLLAFHPALWGTGAAIPLPGTAISLLGKAIPCPAQPPRSCRGVPAARRGLRAARHYAKPCSREEVHCGALSSVRWRRAKRSPAPAQLSPERGPRRCWGTRRQRGSARGQPRPAGRTPGSVFAVPCCRGAQKSSELPAFRD